jgi:dihydroflavonol-4-reductase
LVLTGATGYLGAHLLDELDLDGAIALTRGPAPALAARGIEVRPVGFAGELPEGCRIIHMAGKVDFSAEGQKAMLDLHVEGTRTLARAALKAKCSKFVLLSSSGTTAVSKSARELDESAPYPLEIVSRWPYYLSKLYQERLVLDLCQREGLPAVILNPSLLLGPGDERGGSTQIVSDFLDGKIPVAPAGGIGMVDVRDVAKATVAALEAPAGERYFLGSWNTPFANFFEVLARIADKPAPALTSPRGLAPVGARVLSAVWGKSKLEAMSPSKMEMAEHFWYVNWSKAAAELGFKPRRPEATLRDTVADLRRTP